MRKILWRFLISLVMIITVSSPRPGVAETLRPQLDDMVAHFLSVVYGSEYGLVKTPGVISKWLKGPVNITIQGGPSQAMADKVSAHLFIISKLTGVKFRQAPPGSAGPSIDLIFMKRANMGNIRVPGTNPNVIQTMASDPTMMCYFLAWHKPPQEIVKAIVVINKERSVMRIGSCLLEELTQVMGLPNDVKAYWPTLFNPNDVSIQHSPWDMLYLKTLYDPRLKPGMLPHEAKVVVRKIFQEALSKHSQ